MKKITHCIKTTVTLMTVLISVSIGFKQEQQLGLVPAGAAELLINPFRTSGWGVLQI